MIGELLPPGTVAVETRSDPPEAVLFPEEERLLSQAVQKRRVEFTTVRHCARIALARLGIPAAPILPGKMGAPQWPDGVVGSMTHCVGYRAAVVGLSADLVTVGVDAEPHEALPPDVLGTISLPEERERLVLLAAARPDVHWDRLLFSAKEAVYKSWFPLTRRWLDFEEASVVFEPGPDLGPDLDADLDPSPGPDPRPPGSFYARLLVPGPVVAGVSLSGFAGRWMVRDGLLFTAITLTTGNGPAAGQTTSAERTIVL